MSASFFFESFVLKIANKHWALGQNSYATAGVTFSFAALGELSQKFNLHLIEGVYDPWDFAAYALGAGLALALDKSLLKNSRIQGVSLFPPITYS